MEMAGVKSVEPFAFDAIWDANQAGMAVDVLLNPAPVAFFEFDSLEGAVDAETVEAIYFNSCRFADAAISYCVEVTLQADGKAGACYRSTKSSRWMCALPFPISRNMAWNRRTATASRSSSIPKT